LFVTADCDFNREFFKTFFYKNVALNLKILDVFFWKYTIPLACVV